MHLIHDIDVLGTAGCYRMVVESPQGSTGKFEIDIESGLIMLDRPLSTPMAFPFEYGIFPRTWLDSDENPVDVMTLSTVPTFPGCLVEVRVVGMYRLDDEGKVDNKVLAVCSSDENFSGVKDISDVSRQLKKKIEFYWDNYKKMESHEVTEGHGWTGRDHAETFIKEGISSYQRRYGSVLSI